MNGDVKLIAGFGGSGERYDEFCGRGFEFRGGFVHSDALDGEADGVESDLGSAVAEDGERMSDVTDNFFLLEIEPERDSGMLQIVVAAARVGLIGAELRSGNEDGEEYCERKKHNTPAICKAKKLSNHSALLL
jgi:hypothetical protein